VVALIELHFRVALRATTLSTLPFSDAQEASYHFYMAKAAG